ncbi:Outer membrane protein NlpB, lipoprotein component of the protein assembly complex (forms a complex with YaeT, YfiO, and YfgL) [Marinobacterium lacunae]|uniref:Outer membrane protein NlpB, lipoprotein component of the protein assembly complex (Forms a complex with YaeT, YfiO, and YfgL) n=2 Tax=Marinobacterium lacunae TaxID=1232683 RepID=A0A081FU40_9GAMM|nr:Outer membrane protein NlpB, lipoprotein component of the protein assembly complex (forms a complex with YaeT, YfiO, and YfgL) [Marinobacterium lacunae]
MLEDNPIYGENGLVRDRGQDYEQANARERLKLPPGMRARQTQDQLTVPEVATTASSRQGDFEVPRPEFFYVEAGTDKVNLKREDGERVLVVDEPIADVWVKLQEFWAFNNIVLSRVDPRQGVMETDWITLEGDSYSFVDGWIKRLTFQDIEGDSRNKLRVTLRPDPENYQRTSVRMQHVKFPLAQEVSSIDWDNQARDVEYKADMMFEMLRFLSKSTEPDAQSLLAMQSKKRTGAQLGRDSRGHPVLRMSAPIDESWDQLNVALDKTDIDVGTRDQNAGMVYLTYTTTTPVDDTERMGFFEWLHSDREEIKLDTSVVESALGLGEDEDDPNAIQYSSGKSTSADGEGADGELAASDLADPNNPANQEGYKIWFGGKVLYVFGGKEKGVFNSQTNAYEHTGRYQLKINRTRNGVFLSVLTDQGLAAPDLVAEEILWALKDHLPQSDS